MGSQTILWLVIMTMLAFIHVWYIPHHKRNYLCRIGVQAGSLGNHNMPIVIAWVDEELEQKFVYLR